MTLTHFGDDGEARMVDVSGKPETQRTAEAAERGRLEDEAPAAKPQPNRKRILVTPVELVEVDSGR